MEVSGKLYKYGQWAGWILIIGAIAGVIYWGDFFSQSKDIKIATGDKNTYYYQFGKILKQHLEKNTHFSVQLQVTKGTIDNSSRLLAGETDIAILQGDSASLENFDVISPLWDEAFHLVVRKNSGIKSPNDLKLKNLSIGKKGTGTQVSSLRVLQHYAIDPETLGKSDFEPTDMLRDPTLDAAIIVSNLENANLKLLMESNRFVWLSLEEADGIATFHPFIDVATIPKGIYPTFAGPVPKQQVQTIATTAILVARKNVPFEVVEAVVKTLYSSEVRAEAPLLLSKNILEKEPWNYLYFHQAAQTFFNPHGGLSLLSEFLDNVNRFKYLIILFTIAAILLLNKLRKRGAVKKEKEFLAESKKLKAWLVEIVRIDRDQKKANDSRLLKTYLNEALTVKRKAMDETKDEAVLHSTFFQTFLNECSFIIKEIEWRLDAYIDPK